LQLFITTIKVGSLIGIAVLPFVAAYFAQPGTSPQRPHPEYLSPWWPSWQALDFTKIGAALVAVLWAYHGWMNVAPVAEEIRQPQRNIPIALVGGVAIVMALYLGANLGYYLIIPQSEMAQMKERAPESASQGSEAGGQKSEVRGQRSEVRGDGAEATH